MSFDSFQFDSRINGGLVAQGFTEPTPIQKRAIPVVLAGKDVMGLAQTGTGKTAAFVLPILQRLLRNSRSGVRALILAPTRELAQQIEEVVRDFGLSLGIRSTTVFGGVSMQRQIHDLRRGVDIVVGCPGRVLDLMEQRALDLSRLEVLVLDEADHMFDMGFLPTIRRILRVLPQNRQTLLFSATMPPDIKALTRDALKSPETIEVSNTAPVATVAHALYEVRQDMKSDLLVAVLKSLDSESVLVFTRTKHRAKRLARQLDAAGFKATSLQGNMSQNQREVSMRGFRDGRFQILVATDIAARGIDISTVSHVINFDIPDTVEAYTHRIGRTGRAQRTGDAYTFVAAEDQSMVRSIERMLGSKIPRRTTEGLNIQPLPKAQTSFERRPEERRQSRRPQGDRRDRGNSSFQSDRGESSFQRDRGNSSFQSDRGDNSFQRSNDRPSFGQSGPRRGSRGNFRRRSRRPDAVGVFSAS